MQKRTQDSRSRELWARRIGAQRIRNNTLNQARDPLGFGRIESALPDLHLLPHGSTISVGKGGLRRTDRGTAEGAADGAALGVVTTAEGAAVFVGAVLALALGLVFGALEGASADRSAHGDGHATAGGGDAGRSADAI